MCVGAARPLLGGEGDLLKWLRPVEGLDTILGGVLAMLLVTVGIALLFGVYRGCRWCRLLSWTGWLLLPAVVLYFFVNASCRMGLHASDPLKQGALLNHAVRYLAPAVLMVWMWLGRGSHCRLGLRCAWCLRIAASATFFGHGLNALAGSPSHVELIQLTFGEGVSVSAAETALDVVGGFDIVAAVLLLVRSWRGVALWMGLWGAVTVSSRLIAYGLADGWDDAAIRACNAGVPLVLWMIWPSSSGKSKS